MPTINTTIPAAQTKLFDIVFQNPGYNDSGNISEGIFEFTVVTRGTLTGFAKYALTVTTASSGNLVMCYGNDALNVSAYISDGLVSVYATPSELTYAKISYDARQNVKWSRYARGSAPAGNAFGKTLVRTYRDISGPTYIESGNLSVTLSGNNYDLAVLIAATTTESDIFVIRHDSTGTYISKVGASSIATPTAMFNSGTLTVNISSPGVYWLKGI